MGRPTMSKLSSDVALTTGGVTRLVDRMADAGLVERQRHPPNDRRSVHVCATPEGRATLERAVAAHVEGIDRHLMAPLDAAGSDGARGPTRQGSGRLLLTVLPRRFTAASTTAAGVSAEDRTRVPMPPVCCV